MPKRQPETLLNDWRAAGLPFTSRPKLIEELTEGLSNRSFLIDADNERWVLRLDCSQAAQLGVNRAREITLHELAAKEGLAPHCLVADPERGYLVTRFVAADLMATPVTRETQLECFHTVFTKLHRLQVEDEPFDYLAQMHRLSQDDTLSSEVLNALALIRAEGQQGLCHHDPNPSNIVFTLDGAILLDWEYAAQGYTVIDVAALVHEWDFEVSDAAIKFEMEPRILEAGLVVYREMCSLWTAFAKSLNLV